MGAKQCQEITLALQMIREGTTPERASEFCKVSKSAIIRAMRRHRMKVRPRGRPRKEKLK